MNLYPNLTQRREYLRFTYEGTSIFMIRRSESPEMKKVDLNLMWHGGKIYQLSCEQFLASLSLYEKIKIGKLNLNPIPQKRC